MGICNYCTLESIKAHAARTGGTVELLSHPFTELEDGQDGVDVLVHYKGDAEPTWAAWLMKLPDRCVC